MGTEDHTIKIFVSSPGDVQEERLIAQRVLERLADQFSQVVRIEPIFWEHEPLVATQSFQEGIPSPAETDIVICILWARIGTRLPPKIHRPDGSTYASGTEFEFETAVEGHRQHGQPDLLVYRKTAQPDLKAKGPQDLRVFADQWQALDGFVAKWFHGEDGTLVAAFHPFEQPAGFEQILEVHLRKLINKRLLDLGFSEDVTRVPPPASWTSGSPFRGLEVFDFEHAPIFFGRTRAVSEVLAALRRQAREGRAFLLILGGSGCGKSSLVRAGVLPMLTQPGVIEGVGLWRRAVMRPAAGVRSAGSAVAASAPDTPGDLFDGLAAALVHPAALPELTTDGTSVEHLAEMLRKNPAGVYALVKGALSQAAAIVKPAKEAKAQPEGRLVLVVDQLEEIFSDKRFTAVGRDALFVALANLAQSGKVWVIATLRSDFYHRCEEIPDLKALVGADGQLALSPPTPAEIGQMIRQPASAAGLQFDVDSQTGQTLDDALQNEAIGIKEGLPLLEFALDELYRHAAPNGSSRSDPVPASPRLLKFADYRALKGLAGCLAERAEQTFQELDTEARGVFAKVFRKLVVLDSAERVPTRRIAPMSEFAADPAMVQFVNRFVAARLFIADRSVGPKGGATVRIAHEALLTAADWRALRDWLRADRENLQMHGRLSLAAIRWSEAGRTADLLLQPGKPLDEARNLEAAQFELSVFERAMIEASERQARRRAWLRRVAVTSLAVLAVATATAAILANRSAQKEKAARDDADRNALVATDEKRRADVNAVQAETRRQEAEKAKAVADDDAQQAEAARQAADAAKLAAERRLAESYLDRGLRLFDDGEAGRGALWLARGLEVLPYAHSGVSTGRSNTEARQRNATPDPEHAIRANLRAWLQFITSLKAVLHHQHDVYVVAYSPDGKSVLTGSGAAQLWDAATGKPIGTPHGRQNDYVFAVAYSPDGKTVLTGSGDNTARLLDAATGKPIGAPLKHAGHVNAVAYSPDGKTALTGSDDETARLWDAATGKPIGAPLQQEDPVTAVAYSPDGKTVLTGSGTRLKQSGGARLWDIATGKSIGAPLQLHASVTAVAYGPDGKTVLTGSEDGAAQLSDAATGKPIGAPFYQGVPVTAVAYSPDGKTVLTGSGDKTARLWDVATGKPIGAPLQHQDIVWAVAYSPDGKTILTGSGDKTARLWDAATGKPIGAPLNHQSTVGSVAYSPDGKTVLSGSHDHTARLWDAAMGKPIDVVLQHRNSVWAVAYSPDGKTVLTGTGDPIGGGGEAQLWDTATGKPIGAPLHHQSSVVWAVAYSPDGKTVVTGSADKTARLWDAATGKSIGAPLNHQGSVDHVVYSPDAKTVLTQSRTAQLWDTATGKPIGAPLNHQSTVGSVAYSPDGTTVLTGSEDGTARLWDAATGKPRGTPLQHQDEVRAVAYSPDGKTILTGSADKTARLWDAATGKPIGTPLQHQGYVHAVAYSPDGKSVLTGSRDKTARLWDAATGKPIGAPLQHRDEVSAVAYNPDGKSVLTGSRDKTARLWDAATGKPIGSPLKHQHYVTAVAYSPDGKTVLTGSKDGTARLWRSPMPVVGEPKRITCWLQVLTGTELDEGGAVHVLSAPEWLDQRRRLEALGGPPVP